MDCWWMMSYCGLWVSMVPSDQVTYPCTFPSNPYLVVYPLTLIGIQTRTDTHFHSPTPILFPEIHWQDVKNTTSSWLFLYQESFPKSPKPYSIVCNVLLLISLRVAACHPLCLPDSLCYSFHFDRLYAKHDFIVHYLPTSINLEAMSLQVKEKGYVDLVT